MVIAHNIQAMNAQRQYGINVSQKSRATEHLSSGYQINRAADDAAGLSISEKMRKQIRGLSQASENAEDGISMVQIADGAMAEVHDMIDRGLELSIKAANGTLSYSDRCSIQDEIDQIKLEIDGIKERTKFNEIYVLKGERVERTKEIPAGAENNGATMPAWVNFGSARDDGYMSEVYTNTYQFVVDPTATPQDIRTATVNHAAASIDFSGLTAANASDLAGTGFFATCCTCYSYYSIEFVTGEPTSSEISMESQTFIYKINIDGVASGADLIARIIDGTQNGKPQGHFTEFAADAASPDKLYIYDARSTDTQDDVENSAAGWTAASEWLDWDDPYYNVSADSTSGLFGEGVMVSRTKTVITDYTELPQQIALHIGADAENRMPVRLAVISSHALGIDGVDVRSIAGADKAITDFHEAKAFVSTNRSRMGAYQNRLEHTINNLDNIVENTTAAESQIRDADMAQEMVTFSLASILTQTGEAMIAQANQSNQGVLTLIAA